MARPLTTVLVAVGMALAPVLACARPELPDYGGPKTHAPATASEHFEAGLEALDRADFATARQRMGAAARTGHVKAAATLGSLLVQRPANPGDAREGIRWLTFAAKRGDTEAQYALGVALFDGAGGIPPDHAEALHWFTAAAHAGHPEAAFNVGAFYDDGLAVEKDDAKAAEWYAEAVAGGVVAAMHTLGMMLAVGRGIPRDLRRGAELLARAREEGDADVEGDIRELLRRLPPEEKAELEAALRR
jgi:uncharacterized protein